jgi:hypothetical protein
LAASWVDAGGGVDEGVGLGEAEGYVEIGGAVAGADGEQQLDAGGPGRSMTASRSVAKRTPSRWQWESMSIT